MMADYCELPYLVVVPSGMMNCLDQGPALLENSAPSHARKELDDVGIISVRENPGLGESIA